MAIAERELSGAVHPRAARFSERAGNLYTRQPIYHQNYNREPLYLDSPIDERQASIRKQEIHTLFVSGGVGLNDAPKAFLSEVLTHLCLAAPLNKEGLQVDMAAAAIEAGSQETRGVDIVVSHENRYEQVIPLLGINVKLQGIKPENRNEKHQFNPVLCAPAVNLSLGDWEIDTKEHKGSRIRQWMKDLVLPQIVNSGDIPRILALRKYIFARMNETLTSYLWKTKYYLQGDYEPNEHEKVIFPDNSDDFSPFYNKLVVAQYTFARLARQYSEEQ